jgi:hypothetical protein
MLLYWAQAVSDATLAEDIGGRFNHLSSRISALAMRARFFSAPRPERSAELIASAESLVGAAAQGKAEVIASKQRTTRRDLRA